MFSNKEKLEILNLVESKTLTQAEANRKYGIKGHSTILKWLKNKSNIEYLSNLEKGDVMQKSSKSVSSEKQRIIALEKQVSSIKKELYLAKTKAYLFEKIIDMADAELKTNIKKNYGSELQRLSMKMGISND